MAYQGSTVSIWDTFPKAYFGSTYVPIESSSIEGGLRDHVHEYPHTPGGAPEKLGRKLYTFKALCNFDTNFGNYPGLYPGDLNTMLDDFEQGLTQPLRFPQMEAAVPAYAINWTREMTAKVRSGERVNVTWREDQTTAFLFSGTVQQGSGSLELAANAASTNLAALKQQLQPSLTTLSLMASLTAAVGFITSIKDQALLYDARFAAGVSQVQNLCAQLDGQADLQPQVAYPVIESLHQTWAAAQKMQQDLSATGVPMQQFVNPLTQGIGAIAIQLYGDSSKVSDLLTINQFGDNLRIPAGAIISYYPGA